MVGRACGVVLLLLIIGKPSFAAEPWVGFYFHPQANSNSNHRQFISDFRAMVTSLRKNGINTLVFDMNYGAYHFTCDSRLRQASYAPNRGFTFLEAQRMAEITRESGMRLVVALQVLTHSVGNVFPTVYPQYMLPGKKWQAGVLYTAHADYVQYDGRTYKCLSDHTSKLDNAPGRGSIRWSAEPSNTRDPFNREGEAVVYRMIDELIKAFTVNGQEPEAFHLGCDEVGWWYEQPERETGLSSAQIYAMAVTNAYRHIKAGHPQMEVMMWGDMLDGKWNGMPKSAKYNLNGRNTAAAADLIPKDMIIADWRYEANQRYRYDDTRRLFPSVGEFLDKGFRVWPTSWADVSATRELVWTGNVEQGRRGGVVGHLYSTWLMGMVPELTKLLEDSSYQVPDSVLPGMVGQARERNRQYYRNIADAILSTADEVGVKACRGTDDHCGSYPACTDVSASSGYYGSEFREYFCADNQSQYRVVRFPADYVGRWSFGEGGGAGQGSRGTLMKGATVVDDPVRGRVLHLSGFGPHMKAAKGTELQRGKGSLTIAAWFKAREDAQAGLGTIVSGGADFKSYNLFLHLDGRIWFQINGNNFYRFSATGSSYRDNRWHHVAAVYDQDRTRIDIYLDGTLANGAYLYGDSGSDASGSADLYIGNNNGLGQYEFQGLLDDILIYRRVLTAAEVRLLYLSDFGEQKKRQMQRSTGKNTKRMGV